MANIFLLLSFNAPFFALRFPSWCFFSYLQQINLCWNVMVPSRIRWAFSSLLPSGRDFLPFPHRGSWAWWAFELCPIIRWKSQIWRSQPCLSKSGVFRWKLFAQANKKHRFRGDKETVKDPANCALLLPAIVFLFTWTLVYCTRGLMRALQTRVF